MTVTQPGFVAGRRAVRQVLLETAAGNRSATGFALVACSGGADSLALAACAAAEGRKHGVRVGAVVVDHQMQSGSAQVASRAAQQCAELGLDPVDVVTVHVPQGNGGPEASARSSRYAALDEARQRLGADVVLLGHTLDDQAETVLMGLARGSGARALSGMPAARDALRRPLLTVTRQTTEAICTELGLDWWTDPTNIATNNSRSWPLRSRVRSTLMPALTEVMGPDVAAALARSATQLRDDDDLLRALADGVLNRVRRPGDSAQVGAGMAQGSGAGMRLDVAELRAEHRAVRHRVLHLAATSAGAAAGALNNGHILSIDALIMNWRGQGPLDLPGGVHALRECGTLVLQPTTS